MKKIGVLVPLLLAACATPDKAPELHTNRTDAVELELPPDDEMFLFAIFGDRTGGPADGVKILAEAVEEVNLLDPDLVMTVGDLIQGYGESPAWMEEMREYRGIMDGLTSPWYPVAGNHDVYWRGPGEKPAAEHEPNYERHFGPLWYAFEHKDTWFVVLYTDEADPETGERNFRKPGSQRMSPEQLAWLEETLARSTEAQHVFVFLHHPRWLGGNYGDDWDKVHRVLAQAGNVSAVFAGHIHHMHYDGKRDGIEYFTLATVGGGQSHAVPEAGYLHQYHLVTVRKSGIGVASYPVGSATDPRKITGEVSEETFALARNLEPRFRGRPAFQADGGLVDVIELEIKNPVSRPIEVTLTPVSADSRWHFQPDHLHATVEPGGFETFLLSVSRGANELDDAYRFPRMDLDVDYLAEGLRISLPTRPIDVPLDPAALPEPQRPEAEHVLVLGGAPDVVRVPHRDVELADGPFTLETWMRAAAWQERQGVVAKTDSEYGFFANDGVPSFSVFLDGAYVVATAPDALATGAWHHVAGVYDGVEVRLYVDGQLVDRKAGSGPRGTNTLPLVIGGDVDGSGRAVSLFEGELDEVRLSATARYSGESFTPTRRHANDAETRLLFSMDGMLAGRWLFDGSSHRAQGVLEGGAHVAPAKP